MMAVKVHTPKSEMAAFPVKPLLMLAVVAAAFALAYFTPARKYFGNIQSVKFWLLSLGWLGPAAWMGIVFVLVAAGMPRLLFCPIGGLAFGFWHGLLWTQVATLAGYYALHSVIPRTLCMLSVGNPKLRYYLRVKICR